MEACTRIAPTRPGHLPEFYGPTCGRTLRRTTLHALGSIWCLHGRPLVWQSGDLARGKFLVFRGQYLLGRDPWL